MWLLGAVVDVSGLSAADLAAVIRGALDGLPLLQRMSSFSSPMPLTRLNRSEQQVAVAVKSVEAAESRMAVLTRPICCKWISPGSRRRRRHEAVRF